ncbi:MAG: hypothetical protein KAS32_15610, partial [Candidatus Peribacteraceae bacterium]|nr:hypothetical protein [Candidatus Peribacteraceae bacterium]
MSIVNAKVSYNFNSGFENKDSIGSNDLTIDGAVSGTGIIGESLKHDGINDKSYSTGLASTLGSYTKGLFNFWWN